MGCHCAKSEVKAYINLDSLITTPSNANPNTCLQLTDYSKVMFKLINRARRYPKEFADIIEKSIKYITTESNRLIFSYKLKVALHKGEEVFKATVNELRNMQPLEPFEFKDEIVLETPKIEEEVKDIKVFMNKVVEKKKHVNIEAFFKDAIKDPEIAIIIMLVDDTVNNSGKKRAALLSKEYKYIGISSAFEGKSFCAYYTFMK